MFFGKIHPATKYLCVVCTYMNPLKFKAFFLTTWSCVQQIYFCILGNEILMQECRI